MDGSRESGAGPRRTVRVLRQIWDEDAPRSEERPVVCPSSPGHQPHSTVAVDSAGSASAAARVVASPVVYKQRTDFRLGRGELTVLLEDRPATDTGVYYHMSDLVTMRRRNLVGVLGPMGQAVGKRRPTRLELLGGVVTLLSDMGRLRL